MMSIDPVLVALPFDYVSEVDWSSLIGSEDLLL